MRGRRIAFDYGDVRIGVAICDPDGILCSPISPLKATDTKLFKAIESLFNEFEPIAVYIGLPLHMSGESSQSAEKAQSFGREIEERFATPVRFVDERLSTVSAQKKLLDAGVSTRDSKELIDSMAAVSILELGLQSEK